MWRIGTGVEGRRDTEERNETISIDGIYEFLLKAELNSASSHLHILRYMSYSFILTILVDSSGKFQ